MSEFNPDTSPVANRARGMSRSMSLPSVYAHCERSWRFATALGSVSGISYDAELLFVATMVHDIGLSEPFASAQAPFESVGGAVGAVFAAGAGWGAERQARVVEIVERHMWLSVDAAFDPESHLLEAATALDVTATRIEEWDPALLAEVARALPRDDFANDFDALIVAQAMRGNGSPAHRLHTSGAIGAGERAWARVLGDD